jgi:hypothetical protein
VQAGYSIAVEDVRTAVRRIVGREVWRRENISVRGCITIVEPVIETRWF